MARTPKPWYWKERGAWYVTIRGKRENLGPEKKKAHEKFHRLMGEKPRRITGTLVIAIIDGFLDSLQKSGAADDTFVWYQSRLQCFARRYPDLDVGELRPFHVQQWLDSINRSQGTKRNYARSVMRCMKWAEEQGLIPRSPIAHFKKPKGGVRQTIITPEEYRELLTFIRSPYFRDLLIFAWETGARAEECVAIEKRHIDHHRIVFPPDEEKMQRAPRIIYMTDTAEEIVLRLAKEHPTGPLFRNRDGVPYTTDAINCAFIALQTRMGIKLMDYKPSEEEIAAKIARLTPNRQNGVPKSPAKIREEAMRKLRTIEAKKKARKLCLTAFRHSFCQRLLKAGVDALTVSVLMGHADPSMVAKVYSHLTYAPDYLLEVLKKA